MPRISLGNGTTDNLLWEIDGNVVPYMVASTAPAFRPVGAQAPIDNTKINRYKLKGLPLGIGWSRMDRNPQSPDAGRGVGGALDSTLNTLHRQITLGILHEAQTSATPLDHPKKYLSFKSDLWGFFEQDYSASKHGSTTSAKFDAATDTWIDGEGSSEFNAAATEESSSANPSLAHTVQSTFANRLLVVVAATGGGADPSAVNWDGTAMTKFVDINEGTEVLVTAWYLINPATGTNSVTTTWGATEHQMVVIDFYHVDQSNPVGAETTHTGNGNTATATDIASTRNDLVLFAAATGGSSGGAVTPAAGQTEISDSGSSTVLLGTSYEYAVDADTTCSANFTSDDFAAFGVEINGIGGISRTTTAANGVRVFDAVVHKSSMFVVGNRGGATEEDFMVFSSTDGAIWAEVSPGGLTTTDLLTTTTTRRNNFDDDGARLLDFGNTLMSAIYHDPNSTNGDGSVHVEYSTNSGTSWTAGAVIPSGAGPKAFVNWSDPTTAGNPATPILITAEGIYRVDSGGTTFDLLYALDGDPNNGRWATVGNDGALWCPLGSGGILRYEITGQNSKKVSIVQPPDGFVAARQGYAHSLIAPPLPYILAAYGGQAADKTASIFAISTEPSIDPMTGKQIWPWHSMYSEADDNINLYLLGYSSEDDATPRLHFALEHATDAEMYHLEEPFTNPATGITQKYQASGILRLPVDDLGDAQASAAIYRALVDADDLAASTSNEFILLEDGLDGAVDTANDRGDFLSGDKDLDYGDSGRGISAKKVGTRLTFNRGSTNTKTPKLNEFELDVRNKVTTLRGFQIRVDISKTAALRGPFATAKTVVDDIKAIWDNVPNVPFKAGDSFGEVMVELVNISPATLLYANPTTTDDIMRVNGGFATLTLEEVL